MSIDKYDQALKQALDGMNVPMDLHGIVSAYLQAVGEVIAREEIPDLILSAERNAPGRTKFHLRLSEWDAEKDAAWTDGTAARTPERRAVVMKRLGVSHQRGLPGLRRSDQGHCRTRLDTLVRRGAAAGAPLLLGRLPVTAGEETVP